MLGGCVGRGVRARTISGDRTIVDDTTAPGVLVFHYSEGGLGTQKGASQISVDYAHPFFIVEVFKRYASCGDAGVVEKDIQASECFLRCGKYFLHILGFPDICRYR